MRAHHGEYRTRDYNWGLGQNPQWGPGSLPHWSWKLLAATNALWGANLQHCKYFANGSVTRKICLNELWVSSWVGNFASITPQNSYWQFWKWYATGPTRLSQLSLVKPHLVSIFAATVNYFRPDFETFKYHHHHQQHQHLQQDRQNEVRFQICLLDKISTKRLTYNSTKTARSFLTGASSV